MVICAIVDNQVNKSNSVFHLTRLDVIKAAAESFCRINVKNTPVMLMETGEDKNSLLSFFGDPIEVLEDTIKSIKPFYSTNKNFSSPISYALTIVNKYRIKNGTDRFGQGRCPWIIEPVHIIIFTDGKTYEEKELFLQKTPGTGGDMISDPYRWEHRIFVCITNCSEDVIHAEQENVGLNTSLISLSTLTGGETVYCNGMKEIPSAVAILSEKISKMVVGVKFALHSSSTESIGNAVFGHLNVKATGEWPIPESYWVGQRLEHLPSRSAHPLLLVCPLSSDALSRDASSAGPFSTSQRAEVALAAELELLVDTYDVTLPPAPPLHAQCPPQPTASSMHKALGISRKESYAVYVRGSGRGSYVAEPGFSAPQPGAGPTLNNGDLPFAILRPSSSGSGSELLCLPYNYPQLLPLLKSANDALNKLSASSDAGADRGQLVRQLCGSPWASLWRAELSAYLLTIPPYFYNTTAQTVFRRAGLASLANMATIEFKLNRQPARSIQRYQENAAVDVMAIEAVAREKIVRETTCPNEVAAAVTTCCGQLEPWELPASLRDIPDGELLSMWERQRRALYGGSAGLTVRGLSLVAVEGCGGGVSISGESCWLAVDNASAGPQRSVRRMGGYMELLARREGLRDPECLQPPQDEDSPRERLKRKLTVNFGSRYHRKVRSSQLPASADGLAGRADGDEDLEALFMDTPRAPPEGIASAAADRPKPGSRAAVPRLTTRRGGPAPAAVEATKAAVEEAASRVSPTPAVGRDTPPAAAPLSPHSPTPLSPASSVPAQAQQSPVAIASAPPASPPPTVAVVSSAVWEKHFSNREKRHYWFNTVSGNSVWENPLA